MINVVIVDDHKILVNGLCKLINESGLATVSEVAYNAKECRHLLTFGLPDVLILDVNLPDANGIELCKELMTKYPGLKILALSTFEEYTVVRQMIESGAKGYVVKNAMPEEVIEGIQTVHEGENFLCHEVDLLLRKHSGTSVWLTNRERELLKLVVEGYSILEIADSMFLSPETVKSYRKNLLFKLGARNTIVMVKMALEQKLV